MLGVKRPGISAFLVSVLLACSRLQRAPILRREFLIPVFVAFSNPRLQVLYRSPGLKTICHPPIVSLQEYRFFAGLSKSPPSSSTEQRGTT